MVELGHELVDPLRHVLALLVGLEHPLFEGADLSRLLLDLAPQPRVLAAKSTMRLGQRFDGALESAEVELLAVAIRNGGPPSAAIVPTGRERRQGVDASKCGSGLRPPKLTLARARRGRPAGTAAARRRAS